MGTVKRGYVDTSAGQIHYRSVGSGGAVLLLHQVARSGAIYARLANFLSPYYRVIMMDLPGFGESDPLPVPFEVSDIVESAIALLDGLDIGNVRVSGHHTGAIVAGELAAGHPERVVALASTGYAYLTRDEQQEIFSAPPQPVTELGRHTIPVVRELRSDGSHLSLLFQRATAMLWHSKISQGATGTLMLPFENLLPEDLAFVNDFVLDGLKGLHSAPHTFAAVSRYDPDKRLPLIKAPTLFVRSPGPLEAEYFQRTEMLQKLVPGSRIAAIENGDIHAIYTRAEDLSEILLDFFRDVDGHH